MKPINVLNKLNESINLDKIKKLPDWVIEQFVDGKDKVTYWYCNDCNAYYDEPQTQRTDMEAFYGVGSMFPDHHYEDLLMCPKCEGGLEEVTLYDWEIIDAFLEDEKLSQEIYERFEKEHPDILGQYYREQGTHHCDIFEDHPEYAWEIILEMIG